ncbi:MAG: succinate dehydrogenase iron-sulfur subunit [SAR202 cluster bacterium]|nr:succinate dehydrogenase iron-sulfur subunit [SAR202 cluster bacterium]|tara:strand:+ start:149 stop:1153 length:1005 start_codon:yes stop_codon:yes gene_type:complete
MQVTLNVKRFNPEEDESESFFQDYTLDVEDYYTVLDALIKVREDMDGSLALRCSCRAAICGSCAMRVNGHAKLVCKTKIQDVTTSSENYITVEPMGNMPVIKDLVTDMKPFWDRVRAVRPWLQPEGPEPKEEYVAPNESMLHLNGVMACIMCGCCVSDCTVLEIDKNFLGPAALAKAYRFTADPRDNEDHERLRAYSEYGGIWDCTRCMECVEVCPKGVAPMDRIMGLRDSAMELGFINNNGSRHTEAFNESIRHSGHLDELRLPIKTFGMGGLFVLGSMLNIPAILKNIPNLIGMLPVALRAFRRGKVPPMIHKKIKGHEKIKNIFEKMESNK